LQSYCMNSRWKNKVDCWIRSLECWKMIDDSKLPISYSPWWWLWLREIPKFQVENELGGCIVELRSLEWRWVHCKGFRVCGNMITRMALPNSYSPWWSGLLRDSWVSGEKEWGGCIVTSQNLGRWWWCLYQILPLMMMMIQASQGFLQSGEATAELEQFFLRSWTLNSNPICGWQDFFNQVKLLLRKEQCVNAYMWSLTHTSVIWHWHTFDY